MKTPDLGTDAAEPRSARSPGTQGRRSGLGASDTNPRPARLRYAARMEDALDDRAPRVSRNAMCLYAQLLDGSGTLRLKRLRDMSGLSDADLVDTLNELKERCWIKIIWRHPPPRPTRRRAPSATSTASPPAASAAGATRSPGPSISTRTIPWGAAEVIERPSATACQSLRGRNC